MAYTDYETVVGLEVHAELNTQSKIYCSCKNAFGLEVNTQCCPICMGMPGTLPTLNEKVVEYAVKMGYALNCTINPVSKQDRKNYFYPDLPKAYQISQFDIPLCEHGYVDVLVDGEEKRIGVSTSRRTRASSSTTTALPALWSTSTAAACRSLKSSPSRI